MNFYKQILLLTITLSIFHSVVSQDAACDPKQNTLLYSADNNAFGPEAQSEASVVTGLKFCKFLEGQKSCCSADTINNFKSKVQKLSSNINEKAKSLDENSKKFIMAASKIELESANYTKEMKQLNESSTTTTRILLEVFQRVLQTKGQTGAQTKGQTGTQTKGQTGTQTKNQTGTQTKDQTGTQTKGQTGTQTKDQTGTQTKGQTGTQTKDQTGTQTKDQTGTQTKGQTGTQTKDQTGTQTKGQTGTQTKGQTGTQTKDQTGTKTKDQTGAQIKEGEKGAQTKEGEKGAQTKKGEKGAQIKEGEKGAQIKEGEKGAQGAKNATQGEKGAKNAAKGQNNSTMSEEEMKKKAMGKMTDKEKKAYENMSEADKEKVMAKAKEKIKNQKPMNKDEAMKKGKEMMKEMMKKGKNGKGKGKGINVEKKSKIVDSMENIKKQFGGKSPKEFKNVIRDAQKARAKCFKYLGYLKAQFSCMACDHTKMTSALANGSLSLNTNTCSSVQSKCYDFANLNQNISLMQNGDKMEKQYEKIKKQRKELNQVVGNMTKMEKELEEGGVNNTNATVAKIENAIKELSATQESADASSDEELSATKLPANCTSATNCEYLCQTVVKIDKGGIDFDKAKNPGSNVTVNTSDSASMEKMKKNETTASSRRVLALSNDVKFTAEAPALAEETELQTEVDTSIQEDPADVSTMEVATKLEDETTTSTDANDNNTSAISLQFTLMVSVLLIFLNLI